MKRNSCTLAAALALLSMAPAAVDAQPVPSFDEFRDQIQSPAPLLRSREESLGPGVGAFGTLAGTRDGAGKRLTVIVYAKSDLSAAQKERLSKLGVDPQKASAGGAEVTVSPAQVAAIGRLDSVVHVVSKKLRKMSAPVAEVVAIPRTRGDRTTVNVEIELTGKLAESERAALQSYGVDPKNIVFDRVEATLAPNQLEKLAELEFVRRIQTPKPVSIEADKVVSVGLAQANTLLGIDQLHRRGIDGSGVKVAIIDGGFNLNAPGVGRENILAAEAVCGTADPAKGLIGAEKDGLYHGTGVAQIIRSVAPKAQLALLSVGGGSASSNCLYKGLDRARELGAQVISISMGGVVPTDSFLRSNGQIAQLINSLIIGEGRSLVVAAGNQAQDMLTLSAVETDTNGLVKLGSDGQPFLRFVWPAKYRKTLLPSMAVFVAWDDAYGASARRTTDLRVEVYNKEGQLLARSDSNQLAGDDPLEFVRLDPNDPKLTDLLFLVVKDNIGNIAGRGLRVGLLPTVPLIERTTPERSLSAAPYTLASDSLVVGAVSITDPTLYTIESYSSQGPQQDLNIRPDVVAPTNFRGTIYDTDGQVFNGTSAATPFVSGVVALMRSANPRLTPQEVRQILKDTADPRNGVGNVYGAGLVSPARAVEVAATRSAALKMQRP